MSEDLKSSLLNLQGLEFIYEKQLFPELEYIFKHALTQEVAYNSLLLKRRKEIHEKIGQAIEYLYSERLEEYYDLLAHHYGNSANTPKAVNYLHLAGKQAVKRSAYEEAIGQLSRAVELVETLPETRKHKELELPLQITLGQALFVTEGFTSVEAERAYDRARDLARRLGDASQLFTALNGLRAAQMIRAEHDKGCLLGEELLRVARHTDDRIQLLRALHAIGATSYYRGEFCEAREHLEELLGLYDPKKHRGHDYLSSSANVGVWGLFYFSWTLHDLGYPEQALTRAQEGLALARELSHPFSETAALFGLARIYLERRESKASIETAEAVINLSSEQGFPFFLAYGALFHGAAFADQGDLQEGFAEMCPAIGGMRARGAPVGFSWALANLAEAHGKIGEVGEGLAVVAEGLEFVTKTSERYAEAKLHRLKAELLLDRNPADPARAETSFRDALEVARRQSAKSYELRAATSLARLWQQQDRKQEARELLAPIYQWFTEGFDTRDLKEAKALLEELA
jgi:predicted ATPase